MAISAINNVGNAYGQIASGKRINSAADDAAGLTISKKLESQTRGLNAGTENAQHGKDALNISDGALGQINDYLQRIYELSVKAKNTVTNGPQELSAMQKEVDGLMKGIKDVAIGTEYNGLKLLDGNMADMDLATNPNGTGSSIKMANGTLEALGIDGYDLTGKFDINRIKKAMDMVNESRSKVGAQVNGLEYTIGQNNTMAENMTAGQSRIEDLDMYQAISDMKKKEVLDSYQIMMQKQQEEQEKQKLGIFQF
ncbi:MAG: flagellin [Lachnospiraceae bacterium]|nr:flagellin [Lachnospiraceae bacterium]